MVGRDSTRSRENWQLLVGLISKKKDPVAFCDYGAAVPWLFRVIYIYMYIYTYYTSVDPKYWVGWIQ